MSNNEIDCPFARALNIERPCKGWGLSGSLGYSDVESPMCECYDGFFSKGSIKPVGEKYLEGLIERVRESKRQRTDIKKENVDKKISGLPERSRSPRSR